MNTASGACREKSFSRTAEFTELPRVLLKIAADITCDESMFRILQLLSFEAEEQQRWGLAKAIVVLAYARYSSRVMNDMFWSSLWGIDRFHYWENYIERIQTWFLWSCTK